jgi:hypothetical protein
MTDVLDEDWPVYVDLLPLMDRIHGLARRGLDEFGRELLHDMLDQMEAAVR